MDTLRFKTKTHLIERKNQSIGEDIWGIALDIGYSAVKGFSENSVYSFPSYARKITTSMLSLGSPNVNDILYKDNETGDIWFVGEIAQNLIKADDTTDSELDLYGRNRYFNPMFTVIARTGLGLGMMSNQFGTPNGKTLLVQTGLPPKYLKRDSEYLNEVLSKRHSFSLKVGKKPWINFDFTLPKENIKIMPQPMGTLLSIATTNDGKQVPEAEKYFHSNLLVFDPGFGTLDIFGIRNTTIEVHETFPDLGMKQVLKNTADKIFDRYHVEISVPAMQQALKTGEIKCFDRRKMETKKQPFGDILEECNHQVCMEAIDRIKNMLNNLIDYDYFVITGGTGAAWSSIIKDYFKGMETLKVISGKQNDTLPSIFTNVRGYYAFLYGSLNKRK